MQRRNRATSVLIRPLSGRQILRSVACPATRERSALSIGPGRESFPRVAKSRLSPRCEKTNENAKPNTVLHASDLGFRRGFPARRRGLASIFTLLMRPSRSHMLAFAHRGWVTVRTESTTSTHVDDDTEGHGRSSRSSRCVVELSFSTSVERFVDTASCGSIVRVAWRASGWLRRSPSDATTENSSTS